MAYEPNSGLPRDKARARLGDVTEPYVLDDATYDLLLASAGTFEGGLADIAAAMANKLALSGGDITLGDQKVSDDGEAEAALKLAESLNGRRFAGQGMSVVDPYRRPPLGDYRC